MASPTRRRHSGGNHHDHARIDHTLDISLFTPELLQTDEGLYKALVALDRSWWQDELEPLEHTLRVIMTGPHNLLAYTIAIALDEARYHRLLFTLLQTFPTSASKYISSIASDMVKYLREFYIRMFSLDVPRTLDDCHRAVVLALKVLSALSDLKFDPEGSFSTPHAEENEIIRCKQPQKKNKHAKRQSRSVLTTDPTPFSAIGKDVPRTRVEATELEQQILDDQKGVLEEYFRVLRLPNLASTITNLYVFSEIPSVPRPVDPEPASLKSNRPEHDVYVTPEVPPAYPQIQPLKAAKYFSDPAEGFGPWNIFLSSRAIQQLKSFHRDEAQWKIIKKKMQELSTGFFSDSNQKRLKGGESEGVHIYEAKLTRDLRIVYQIDIAPDDANGNDRQIIKIWGIHTHAQMDNRLWKSISHHQSRIGGEYRRRCMYRESPKRPGSNIILPASWDSVVETLPTQDISEGRDVSMTAEEQLELHSILALEKFTRMSQALMNSIITGQDDIYPFELTGSEQKIRDHSSSCFVLGRSGTGKTTTMVFKMIAREMLNIQQAVDSDSTPTPKYRQLFVTQSRILAGRVQDYFGKMLLSQSVGRKTSQEVERLALRNQRVSGDDDMLDVDEDDDDERSDLPKKFSDLEDHHFPLFLTVDQLYKLLECDCKLSFKRRPRTKEHRRAEQQSHSVVVDDHMDLDDEDLTKDEDITSVSPSSGRHADKASIITFETFFYTYWPHFPQPLTKGLDPALVWNEIMGVIKGSEESLDNEDDSNFLDKENYLKLSHRRQSTFSKHRERVYCIFESYNKLKQTRGDYDAADRTHAILRALKGDLPGGRNVDFLYVDEAQDNLIVDARLLRQLCGNPHGLFWAGDTAQTISMGSSFRFDDLKAFLYRLESRSCHLRAPVRPASFQLAINYRSHAGVVNCARSVIELITKFWPDSIDNLAPERGVVDGPRPVFFRGWDSKAARYEQFLFHESGNIEFGAQQCILVRDEKSREDLRREIGDVGLIMTLYESKGLEFNDVLLYNFFDDSTASFAEWRAILNAVEEFKRHNVGVPQFDKTRHSSLCSELKSLYVGITRARRHVWILDIPSGEDKGGPMCVFWESKNLVQICRPGDQIPELAVSSTSEQWAHQGRALFKTKHYQQAIFCFERAGLLLERSIAHAYLLRRTAQRIALSEQGAHKNAAYLRAAEAFVVCGRLSFLTPRPRYLGLGADCFVAAGAHASAAQAYLGAENFTKAAQHFKSAKLFDEVADVVLLHPGDVDPIVALQCKSIAKLHFHKEHQPQKARRLFESLDEQLQYLEEYGFDVERCTILQDLGRWGDAAEIHYAEGRPLEAISLWLRAGDTVSRQRAKIGLLNSLWVTLPLGTVPDDKHHTRLLELLRILSTELVHETDREESIMFLAIFAKDVTQLLRLAREFYHGKRKNPVGALLCFDHALATSPHIHNESGQSLARYLEDYDAYAQLMRQVILFSQKHQAGHWGYVAKLLGFTETNYDPTAGAPVELHVLPTSILYGSLKDGNTFIQPTESIPVTSRHLSVLIHQVLGRRLGARLMEEHGICLRSRPLRPCLNFALYGNCGRQECHREHVPRESLGADAFNLRTRLHMQQILIVHNMGIFLDYGDRRKLQRIWQERLYETWFPVFYAFGQISVLNMPSSLSAVAAASSARLSSIPEYQRASNALSNWLYDRFYSIRPYRNDREDKFMTETVQVATLWFAIDRHGAAHYVWRADVVQPGYQHSRLLRKEGYVVHDLLVFLEGSSETSVASGVLFIKHILDHRIPIDTNTLLNVLEAVVGRTIMASRPLHELTLPRSWILNLLSNWDERCRIPNAYIVQFLFGPLAELLENIYSNNDVDHLIYEGRPLATLFLHSTARTVMIFRICKCLTLLGYNIRNPKLRDDVGKTLASLSKPGRVFSPLILPYVKANQWSELARAIRSSSESPLDELILLRNSKAENMPNIYNPPRGIRLLRFDSIYDLLSTLQYTTGKFNPEAKPFVPSAVLQQPTSLPDVEPIEDDLAMEESFENETEATVEVVAPDDLTVKRTDAEIQAATTIQFWYRRKFAVKPLSNSEISRSRLYADCLANVDKLPVQVSFQYRCRFLGPLPHILAALRGCGSAVTTEKKQVMRRLMKATENLEAADETITECIRLNKTHIRLWKDLEPSSKLHLEGSIDKLKLRVEEVNMLVKDTLVVSPNTEGLLWDMEVGYKGIVRDAVPALPPSPTAKSAKRPSLNTEDIDI